MELLNWVDILLYIVNLVILFLVLRKFLYKPVAKFLAAREKSIADQLDEAAQKYEEAESMREKYENLITESKNEATEIVSRGHQRAEQQYNEAVARGKEEVDNLVQRALKEIDMERKAAYDVMRVQIAEMAVSLAEKVLEREVTMEDNQQIIDEFFEKVG